jgi:hypothetical protein
VPPLVSLIHLAFLAAVVLLAHHPVLFLGLFLLFLGFTQAYQRYQDPLILKEGLLVGFFLAGLVVLGGMQQWWLQPIVSSLAPTALFFGALGLTAVTDNAALTYLGSLIAGLSEHAKYMLVAGAVAGGGLTVIANAPNPAGAPCCATASPTNRSAPSACSLGALGPTSCRSLDVPDLNERRMDDTVLVGKTATIERCCRAPAKSTRRTRPPSSATSRARTRPR